MAWNLECRPNTHLSSQPVSPHVDRQPCLRLPGQCAGSTITVAVMQHCSSRLPSCVQGPVAHVHISEVSLGRSNTASKALQGVAKAASTRHFKVPFSIRGMKIELRDAAEQQAGVRPVAPAANSSKHSAAGSQKPRKQMGVIKLLTNSVLRIVVGLLPSIPLRIKDVEVVHQVTVRQ